MPRRAPPDFPSAQGRYILDEDALVGTVSIQMNALETTPIFTGREDFLQSINNSLLLAFVAAGVIVRCEIRCDVEDVCAAEAERRMGRMSAIREACYEARGVGLEDLEATQLVQP